MTHIRRRAVAIVETSKGIIVVAGGKEHNSEFMLPGGGAEWWESRKRAAIRELREETSLKTKKITYLFKYIGRRKWRMHNGRIVRNHTKVFLIEAEGTPKPANEIKRLAYWKPKSKIKITEGTRNSIERYLKEFKQ